MSLINELMIDSTKHAETRDAIIRSFHLSAKAAYDYAMYALNAAATCYRAAEAGDPLSTVYTAYSEYPRHVDSAQKMATATAELASIACAIQESQDEEANEAYAEHLMEMSKTDQVSAMLEAAHRRMVVFNSALPSVIAPAARLNTEVFKPSK